MEVCFPILQNKIAERIQKELELYLIDNQNSWALHADGEYQLVAQEQGSAALSAQIELLDKYAQ